MNIAKTNANPINIIAPTKIAAKRLLTNISFCMINYLITRDQLKFLLLR